MGYKFSTDRKILAQVCQYKCRNIKAVQTEIKNLLSVIPGYFRLSVHIMIPSKMPYRFVFAA